MFVSTLNKQLLSNKLVNGRNETIARRVGCHWLSSSNQPIADTTIRTLSSKPGYKLVNG